MVQHFWFQISTANNITFLESDCYYKLSSKDKLKTNILFTGNIDKSWKHKKNKQKILKDKSEKSDNQPVSPTYDTFISCKAYLSFFKLDNLLLSLIDLINPTVRLRTSTCASIASGSNVSCKRLSALSVTARIKIRKIFLNVKVVFLVRPLLAKSTTARLSLPRKFPTAQPKTLNEDAIAFSWNTNIKLKEFAGIELNVVKRTLN